MGIIREHISQFERGKDPKEAMKIGLISKIKEWLEDYKIKGYHINDDFSITVYTEVNLNSAGLMELPDFIKFEGAHSDFHINWNNLKNMKGCPTYVHGHFFVNGNPLTSLEGIPETILGSISISMVCGFKEEDIKKVCDVKTVFLTNTDKEKTMAMLQNNIRKRYIRK
jgi:hypothetical protein